MTETTEPVISICIATGRRPEMLDACLASLQQQVDPPPFEVLVCSTHDPDLAAIVRPRFPDATLGLVLSANPGGARNYLVARARGEFLLFLDDDVLVRPDTLRRVAELARVHPDVDVFGGPNETPPRSSRFQVVQGAVLASLGATGPVRRRYGVHPAGAADERFFILCNLAVRRRVMLPFADEMICAEENAVLVDLSRRGIRMRYDPSLVVFHERRVSFRGFVQQMVKYGRGRGQLLRRDPRSFRLAYFVPAALVAYCCSLVVTWSIIGPASLVPLAIYAGVVAASGLRVARTLRRPSAAPLAAVLAVALHVSYGVGTILGVVRRGRRRIRTAQRDTVWADLGEIGAPPVPPPGAKLPDRPHDLSRSPGP